MDFSKRNNTGNFIIRSPEISYWSQNTNTRDFRGNERGFSSHSARKCESRNDYSWRQNGRVSDVSMRSVTPVKTGNSFYDNGSFGKQSNPNPFSKNSTSRENQFASKQNFLNDNQSFKVFEKPQNRNNPFLPNNTDKFNNSEISNPFKVKNSSNATNSFGKTSISKIFEAKSSNPFAKFSVDKENIVNNYQIDFIQPCKVEPIQKLHFVNNMNIMGNQAAVMNLNPSKTPAEILSEVCNYFLHTQSVTTDHDLNNSPQIQELQLTENKQFIVKPLSEIYLKDIPVNDSFKELYKKEQMYDIDLYFPKDKVHIQAHKIVLSTVDKLKQHIETKLKDRISGDMPVIEFSLDYGSEVFSKVLKILYLGTNKIYDINLAEGREMYRLACKLGAKNVQRYLVIYWLLPKLNLSQCLSVLEDAYNRISQTTVDEIVKMLFEFTIIYWARRFSILWNSKIEVLLKLDRHLLKILVSKSLYFATDEHDVLNFLKIVVNKETNDIYGFLSKISEPYRKTVAYNYKSINIALILKELGSSPMRYPYLNSEVSSKSCKYGFGKSQAQLDSKRKSLNLKKLEEVRSNEFENQSPLENRIPLNHEINSKDFNLDLTIKINPEDFSKEGVTFFSEWFYSFSATWNLMIDILPSGAVNVYLVERTYRQPQSLAESNNMTVFNYQSRIANQSLKPKDLINDGKNATFLINYKSVLFSVSLIDARLTKDFKIFYSFCKDQNQAIGWENFFNISQLSCQDFIHLRVKILEDILHSSTLHAISSHFSEMANIIAEKYPEWERQINYCFSNKDESRNSDDYKRPSIDRYDDFGLNKNNKNQYEYFLDNKRKRRPSTPPSWTKNKWQLDCGKESKILIIKILILNRKARRQKTFESKPSFQIWLLFKHPVLRFIIFAWFRFHKRWIRANNSWCGLSLRHDGDPRQCSH